MEKKEEILRVRNLDISFETTAGVVNAVRGVNLTVNRGETVAIVGESGSGKSVSAKAIMGILAKNGTIDRGQITFSYYRNPVHWKRNPTTCRLCLGGTFLSVKRLNYKQR